MTTLKTLKDIPFKRFVNGDIEDMHDLKKMIKGEAINWIKK